MPGLIIGKGCILTTTLPLTVPEQVLSLTDTSEYSPPSVTLNTKGVEVILLTVILFIPL